MSDTPVDTDEDFENDEDIFEPDYEPSTETAPLEDGEKIEDPDAEEEHEIIPQQRYGGPFLNEIEAEQRKSRIFAQDEPQEDSNV